MPAASTVATMVSRIIGIGSTLRSRGLQRGSYFGQPGLVLARLINGASPGQGHVLHIALPQPPSDLRLHQFGAEIEGMGAVRFDAKLRVERHRVRRHVMTMAVVNMDAVIGNLDAKIGVRDLSGEFSDFAG